MDTPENTEKRHVCTINRFYCVMHVLFLAYITSYFHIPSVPHIVVMDILFLAVNHLV